jgi:predicted ATPase
VNAAEAAALLETLPPAGRLETRLRLLASGKHPQVWLPRQRPVVLGMALRAALREGVDAEHAAQILRDSSVMEGPVSIADLTVVPMALRSTSWLSWWCRYLPRILVCAARGAIPATAGDRTYTPDEQSEMLTYCVTAEAEALSQWLTLAQWAIEHLYPEWQQRKGRDHACFQRVLEMARVVDCETWTVINEE